MKTPDELWEDIGSLTEDETVHVLTKLYTMYEDQLKKDPESKEVAQFFRNLETSIALTSECNLNRR